nr:serine protease snake-like [Aedes albopictus]
MMSDDSCCRFVSLLWCGLFLTWIALVQGQQQRIAELKCREYIARNTETSYAADLGLDPEITAYKRTNCSTSIDLIINGEEALVGEFPHQALLGRPKENAKWEFYCGGSLISEWFILTAAHCHRPTIVRLGEHDLREPTYDVVDYSIKYYIKHPSYTGRRSYYDISLVKLDRDVEFNNLIRPACLWTKDPFNMTSVVATGFGTTEFGVANDSPVLLKAILNVMEHSKCQQKYVGYRKFTEGIKPEQMCVGSKADGKDTCNGDSGGPIQVATDVNTCAYYIVGVTSSGGTCGIGTTASVYTKVASYLDWIEEIVWPYEWSERQDQSEESTLLYDSSRIIFPDTK